jgi:hypothetical protein
MAGDPGIVKTMRGANLSMYELRMKSKKPLTSGADAKDKVSSRQMPPKQLNVVGFMPSMEGMAPPQQSTEAAPPERLRPMRPIGGREVIEEDATTMADLTGIVVDKSTKGRPEDPNAHVDETFNEIMGELHQQKERVGIPPRSDQPRRSRKA